MLIEIVELIKFNNLLENVKKGNNDISTTTEILHYVIKKNNAVTFLKDSYIQYLKMKNDWQG